MKTLTIIAVARSVSSTADAAGKAQRSLALSSIPKPTTPVGASGPNDALFADPRTGNFNLQGAGLSAEALSGFEAGKRYKITVEEIEG